MHPHFSRNVRKDFVTVFEDDAEGRVRKTLLDDSVNFNGLFFGRTLSPLANDVQCG